jgi:hypothetical protein
MRPDLPNCPECGRLMTFDAYLWGESTLKGIPFLRCFDCECGVRAAAGPHLFHFDPDTREVILQ